MILDILLRIRIKPVILAGDIRQAFLQIIIRETGSDALRFIWVDDISNKNPVVLRATGTLFGLGPSPFLVGGTLQEHLSKYESRPEYEEAVKEIGEGIYVDDIHLSGETTDQTSSYKEKAVTIFEEGGFCLHKWHSNVKGMNLSQPLQRKAVESNMKPSSWVCHGIRKRTQ